MSFNSGAYFGSRSICHHGRAAKAPAKPTSKETISARRYKARCAIAGRRGWCGRSRRRRRSRRLRAAQTGRSPSGSLTTIAYCTSCTPLACATGNSSGPNSTIAGCVLGTSPLYAFKQAAGAGGTLSPETVMGVVSLILWSLILMCLLRVACRDPALNGIDPEQITYYFSPGDGRCQRQGSRDGGLARAALRGNAPRRQPPGGLFRRAPRAGRGGRARSRDLTDLVARIGR